MEPDKVSHYRIIEKLGAGGMGEVYLAEDMKLGRKIAIKILSEEFTTNKDRLHRFEQEASASSNLNHPNILTIHEMGIDEGRHYIATEYIDGVTLRRKMAASQLETHTILDIAVQVGSALEEAHAAGIVHRDIKPDNIMVRRNGYVKVLDFGLAKLTETVDRSPADAEAATRVLVHTDAGVVMGTSHYMSPEQARGKPVDARSDIWSLGVVIYELIAGRTPFEGETSTDVIVAITQKEPPPLARFAPDVPAELDWIVMKALRKDRDERYQTIKELITDLKRLKQRLEFQTELERSAAPGSFTRSKTSDFPGAPTTIDQQPVPTAEKTISHVSSAEYIVTGIKRNKLAAALIVLVLLVVSASAFYFYKRNSHPLMTERDTVLLTDFVNTTGEPVFDGTLKQALAVNLGQTPFLNLFPDDRVRETLRFMGRSPDDRITRDVGREICERQGIKAMLTGTIAGLGSHYVITLEAVNPRSGDPVAREQIEAESKEKVLASLSTAAMNLRKKLGESLSSMQKYDVNIEQATTSSLEALKAYTMANDERAKGRSREALTFYKRAVDLDPNFAMAYARIGVQYVNEEQLETAKEYVQKAYELRDRVSERERLYIEEKYYSYITGEIDQTIETLKTWARLYPNDFIPHNNLSLNYRLIGRNEEALPEALEAVRLSPNNISGHDNLVDSFMSLGRFDEAEQAGREAQKINPDSFTAHLKNYQFAFLRQDQAAMEREANWAKGKPEEGQFTGLLSLAALYSGKLKQSEELRKRAVEMLKQQNRTENASSVLMGLANDLMYIGKCDQAKANAKAALELLRGQMNLANGAAIYAACDDRDQAQKLLDEARNAYPKNTVINSIVPPIVTAGIEESRGNVTEAIKLFESIRGYEGGMVLGLGTTFARGNLYLKQRMGNEAAAEFKKVIDQRGVDMLSCTHVLAHLGLGRALALNGDTAGARKAYQDFFALWKDADHDLSVLVEARKEYEAIR
ncbi:MAG: eukaryotic-like serine/threonine-protein kinase [Acidobacteriota bacterium]|jgi:serine/threonine protein kinase/tetratricopeptide (TPR) repeat protein